MREKVLGLLGLALRGGNLALGEAPVAEACTTRRACLVLLAEDAAENSVDRASRLAQRAGVPEVRLPYAKQELGVRLGRSSCAVLALTHQGLAAAVAARLAQMKPELEPLALALAQCPPKGGRERKNVGRRRTPPNV